MTPEELARVQEAAERLYTGQLTRWGLTCALEPWAAARLEIQALREQVYRGKLPHMLEEGAPVDADDERAFHFVARREEQGARAAVPAEAGEAASSGTDGAAAGGAGEAAPVQAPGRAVAALRLLPPPFEAREIFPDLDKILEPGRRYIELGRLVGDANEPGASRVLALHALVWGLAQREYDGLMAYARERASKHFRLLGMEVAATRDAVPIRDNKPYVLLTAHLENTMRALGTWG